MEETKKEEVKDEESEEEVDIDNEIEAMNAGGSAAVAQSDNILADMVVEEGSDGDNDAIKKVRMYDLSITYDRWTHTPRLWLQGYSEDGDLLT